MTYPVQRAALIALHSPDQCAHTACTVLVDHPLGQVYVRCTHCDNAWVATLQEDPTPQHRIISRNYQDHVGGRYAVTAPHTIVCTCGAYLFANTEADLDQAWVDHHKLFNPTVRKGRKRGR